MFFFFKHSFNLLLYHLNYSWGMVANEQYVVFVKNGTGMPVYYTLMPSLCPPRNLGWYTNLTSIHTIFWHGLGHTLLSLSLPLVAPNNVILVSLYSLWKPQPWLRATFGFPFYLIKNFYAPWPWSGRCHSFLPYLHN